MVTEIARKDVQELSGRQQVQDFFAALGYDTALRPLGGTDEVFS
jgi:hypothetical protein